MSNRSGCTTHFAATLVASRGPLIFMVAAIAAIGTARTSAEVVAPSIAAGTSYQLVFTTRAGRDAFSSDISTYNAFVRQQAAQNTELPSTTWWAVASTGRSASSNAMVYDNVPIYNTAGELVAANGSDFYSSSHAASMAYDQFGAVRWNQVWTGIYADGTPKDYLDAIRPATTYGHSGLVNQGWAYDGTSYNNVDSHSLYALSERLVAVPEPGGLALVASACVFIGMLGKGSFASSRSIT